MRVPEQPVTLTPEQIADLTAKLADLRHNINNYLALIVAGTELIRRRPESATRFLDSFSDPPQKIADEVRSFSKYLEEKLQVTRL
jgi:hypothetical protein